MNALRISWKFISKGKFISVFIVLLSTLAVYQLINGLGLLQFTNYTLNIYKKADLEQTVYFMPNFVPGFSGMGDNGKSRERLIKETKERIEALDGVSYCSSDTYISTKVSDEYPINRSIRAITDEFLYNVNSFELDSGEWFSKDAEREEGIVRAVVTGTRGSCDFKVGEIIPFKYQAAMSSEVIGTVKVQIIGILKSPGYYISCNGGGRPLITDQMVLSEESFIIEDNDFNRSVFGENFERASVTAGSFYVNFSKDITPEQKSAALEKMSEEGSYCDYETLIADTYAHNKTKSTTLLMTVVPLLLSSMIAFISVFALKIFDSISDFSVYYICGASWKKCFYCAALGLLQLFLVPVAVSIGYICSVNPIRRIYPDYLTTILDASVFNDYTFLFVGAYLAVCAIVSILLPYLMFRKMSPSEIYRGAKL